MTVRHGVFGRVLQLCVADTPVGSLPLHYAARSGRAAAVEFLLRLEPVTLHVSFKIATARASSHSFSLTELTQTSSKSGDAPLHLAAGCGHVEVRRTLSFASVTAYANEFVQGNPCTAGGWA